MLVIEKGGFFTFSEQPLLLPFFPVLPRRLVRLLQDPLLLLLVLPSFQGIPLLALYFTLVLGFLLSFLFLVLEIFLSLFMVWELFGIFIELEGCLIHSLFIGKFFLDGLISFLIQLLEFAFCFGFKLPGRVDEEINSGLDDIPFSSEPVLPVLLCLKVGLVLLLMPFVFLLKDLKTLLTDVALSQFNGVLKFVLFSL